MGSLFGDEGSAQRIAREGKKRWLFLINCRNRWGSQEKSGRPCQLPRSDWELAKHT